MKILLSTIIILLLIQTAINYIKGNKNHVLGCGLLAFSGKSEFDPMKLKILFLYNEERGKHSCGIYNHVVNYDHIQQNIYKRSGLASKTLVQNANIRLSKLCVGHTRAATMGVSGDVKGAHPFYFDGGENGREIIGAHNGVIDNYDLLLEKYEYNKTDCSVDSMIFFKYFSLNNDYKVLEDFEGKASLIWTSPTDNNKIHFFTNGKRPLFRGSVNSDGHENIYLSSLESSLEAIGCENIKSVPVDKVFTMINGVIQDNPVKIVNNPLKSEVVVSDDTNKEVHVRTRISTINNTINGVTWETIKYSDGSVSKINKNTNIYPILKKETFTKHENGLYMVHRKLYYNGGYEEVFFPMKKLGKDLSIDSEETILYIAEVYSKLDEYRNTLKDLMSEQEFMTDKFKLEDLDNIIMNMESFAGSVHEESEN